MAVFEEPDISAFFIRLKSILFLDKFGISLFKF